MAMSFFFCITWQGASDELHPVSQQTISKKFNWTATQKREPLAPKINIYIYTSLLYDLEAWALNSLEDRGKQAAMHH